MDPLAQWTASDHYIGDKLIGDDAALAAVLEANQKAGLPAIDVSPAQGKLLYLLAKMVGAERILEIGTLGGYSTIWLARALGEGGELITLEIDPGYAETARANIKRAGLSNRVDIRIGPALDTLVAMDEGDFDLTFIDADKVNSAAYLDQAVRLSRSGAVIVCDNVVREGRVADKAVENDAVIGIRAMFDAIAADPRLEATAIQTVGEKGWDGFALIRVK